MAFDKKAYYKKWRQKPESKAKIAGYNRQFSEKFPGKAKQSNRRWWLWHKYGLTLEAYESMAADQNGCCAICKALPKPHGRNKANGLFVDHCHATGHVRGLLCHSCNAAIGHARESTAILMAAVAYLEKTKKAPAVFRWSLADCPLMIT